MQRHEFRVLSGYDDRVTRVDGAWQGSQPAKDDPIGRSCPMLATVLERLGEQGWAISTSLPTHKDGYGGMSWMIILSRPK